MKILAVDYGDARTGLAICDAGEMLASPVGVIHSHRMDEVVQKAAEAAREQRAERIVVGNPINMNGTQGPACEKVRAFGEALSIRCPVEQDYFDERLTSAQANRVLISADVSRKKRKNVVDMLAAQLILQAYIDARS